MHRQGCVDSVLTQQVEKMLSDTALQDYTAAFAPGSVGKTQDSSARFIPRFISKFHDYTSGLRSDQTCTAASSPANEQQQNGLTAESTAKKSSEKYISISTTESSANIQACSGEVSTAATGEIKNNAKSPVPTSPVQENTSVTATPVPPPLKENLVTDATQVRFNKLKSR